MNGLVKQVIAKDALTIKQVMRIIDNSELGIAFIVDTTNRFIGLVTDGDIRRAIIEGISIEKNIKKIIRTDPLTIPLNWSDQKIKDFFLLKNNLLRIPRFASMKTPILDKNKKIIGILFISYKNNQIIIEKPTIINLRHKKLIRRILVIGGAGYLGSILIRKLLAEGFRVRVLDNLLYGKSGLKGIKDKKFEFIKGDIRDISILVESMKNIDAIIHLAAIVGDPASAQNPQRTIEINYFATRAIAEIAKYYQINRFIFASTCSVYGANKETVSFLNENSQTNPLSLYADMKLESEKALLELEDSNFSPTIFRMGTLYGVSQRMRFDLVVNILTAKAIHDKKISIFGGEQVRPLLHLEDAANAYIECLRAPIEYVKGQIINVGSNSENYKIINIGKIIKKLIPEAALEINKNTTDKRNYRVNFNKIHRIFTFKTKHSVIDGVKEIIKYIYDKNISNYLDDKYHNNKYLEKKDLIASHESE